MPVPAYGVVKGRVIDRRLAAYNSPHYQLHVIDEQTDYRVAVNVQSDEQPSNLLYFVNENFQHPVLADILQLPTGYNALASQPGGAALDFIRDNLFSPDQMQIITEDTLSNLVDSYVQKAMSDETAMVYAFGSRWGPETKRDPYFGFTPGNGIHDIHMNQGNDGTFTQDDGVWQDGALMINFPSTNRWVAIFLKFQSQSWHTDDKTGHTINVTQPQLIPAPQFTPAPQPAPVKTPIAAQIVAALVNTGDSTEKVPQTITLINLSPNTIDLQNWAIANRNKNKIYLSGTVEAGNTAVIALSADVTLNTDGGIITLLDQNGLKVHGVSYTSQQAKEAGWTIAF